MSSNNNLNEEEEILFFYEDPKSFDEKNLYEVNRAPWFYHLINVLGLTKDNFMEIKHMVEDKKNNILNLINYKSYTDNYLKKNDTMKNMLCAYLYSCKTSLYEYSKNINSEQNIHFFFTFGNITADLDSVCSSIIYSFFLFIWYSLKTNLIGKKKDDPLMFFIPVINIKKNDMKLKILIIWWLEKCGIENPEELLIFNDDLNLLEVLKNDTKYDTCLVDFNKSENNCVYNINNIKSIIDHHILNEEMKNKKITKSVFPIYVCSCMVIIAYFYKYSSEFLGISLLNRDIMWLIYGTMLKDSNNFPKDDFRKRWIQSDLNIYLSMKKYFRIPDIMDIYITQKFNNIRFSIDLKKFGIENLLFVDYKDYNYDIQGKKFTIRICSLDFSVESILSHENVDTLVNKMCELCEENKFAAFILMGSYMINYVFHKDIGLLFFNEDITKDKLLTALIANQDINLCEKGFKKITCKNESRNIDLFQINNTSYSRKRLECFLNIKKNEYYLYIH
ncbi:hypothetical protein PFAG_05077 [Plasmodium falciparum Santa Lucia]|uniref:DHHA2 domain-containing protein n=1 Tax=Plasmodium falciparum Santa Lucia TaxID=478859 RepID=W7FNG4_PLAFA|nr:hypothetical protein PFAG_05077 [Plasmodium falciparum Santa Lucia]